MTHRFSVILLNWNGWQDTIECICSLYNQDYKNLDIVLIDNNSQDESIVKINEWAKKPYYPENSEFSKFFTDSLPEEFALVKVLENEGIPNLKSLSGVQIYLISNTENLGFAKANNQGIRFAINNLKSKFYFLLNNDTVAHPKAINNLLKAAEENEEVSAFQPAIFFYSQPETVWHVGGVILPWIQTKYFKTIRKEKYRATQTITGCALLLRESTIENIGYLSEQFFHGEEDLNYSLRLIKEDHKALIVNDSRIFHKVSVSAKKQWGDMTERVANASLNRIINAKTFFSSTKWYVWRVVTIVYYWLLMVFRYKQNLFNSAKLLKNVYTYSNYVTEVDNKIINRVMEGCK